MEWQYDDMINCKLVLPSVNRYIKMPGGMKSGWCLTALDNSLIHRAIVDSFVWHNNLKDLHFLVYGDDVVFFSHVDNDIINLDLTQ